MKTIGKSYGSKVTLFVMSLMILSASACGGGNLRSPQATIYYASYEEDAGKSNDSTYWYTWFVRVKNESTGPVEIYCDVYLLDNNGASLDSDLGSVYLQAGSSGYVRGENYIERRNAINPVSIEPNCRVYPK